MIVSGLTDDSKVTCWGCELIARHGMAEKMKYRIKIRENVAANYLEDRRWQH